MKLKVLVPLWGSILFTLGCSEFGNSSKDKDKEKPGPNPPGLVCTGELNEQDPQCLSPEKTAYFNNEFVRIDRAIPNLPMDQKNTDLWVPIQSDIEFVETRLIYLCEVVGMEPCTPLDGAMSAPDFTKCKFQNNSENTGGRHFQNVIADNANCPVALNYSGRKFEEPHSEGQQENRSQNYTADLKLELGWPSYLSIKNLRSSLRSISLYGSENSETGGYGKYEVTTRFGEVLVHEYAFHHITAKGTERDLSGYEVTTLVRVDGNIFGGKVIHQSGQSSYSLNQARVDRETFESVFGSVERAAVMQLNQ